jgi:hypothetical protein
MNNFRFFLATWNQGVDDYTERQNQVADESYAKDSPLLLTHSKHLTIPNTHVYSLFPIIDPSLKISGSDKQNQSSRT